MAIRDSQGNPILNADEMARSVGGPGVPVNGSGLNMAAQTPQQLSPLALMEAQPPAAPPPPGQPSWRDTGVSAMDTTPANVGSQARDLFNRMRVEEATPENPLERPVSEGYVENPRDINQDYAGGMRDLVGNVVAAGLGLPTPRDKKDAAARQKTQDDYAAFDHNLKRTEASAKLFPAASRIVAQAAPDQRAAVARSQAEQLAPIFDVPVEEVERIINIGAEQDQDKMEAMFNLVGQVAHPVVAQAMLTAIAMGDFNKAEAYHDATVELFGQPSEIDPDASQTNVSINGGPTQLMTNREIAAYKRKNPNANVLGVSREGDQNITFEYFGEASVDDTWKKLIEPLILKGPAMADREEMLNILSASLENTYTGTGAEFMLTIKKAAQTLFGIEVEGVREAEVAQNTANRLGIMLREDISDVQLTEAERRWFTQLPANLTNTPAANKLIVAIFRKKIQRERDFLSFANAWRKENRADLNAGKLDALDFHTDWVDERQRLGSVMTVEEFNEISGYAEKTTEGAPTPFAGTPFNPNRPENGNEDDIEVIGGEIPGFGSGPGGGQ